GAWRSSMKPSVISQALPSATSRMAPPSSRVEPVLPSSTVVMESRASPSQQPTRTFEADMATSSVQYVHQREQQHPDQIDHVPIEHAGLHPTVVLRRVGAAPAALGHPAEDHH